MAAPSECDNAKRWSVYSATGEPIAWFFKLVPSDTCAALLDRDPPNLIVCFDSASVGWKKTPARLFAGFSDASRLFCWLNDIPRQSRFVYEVFLDSQARKPYFDVDFEPPNPSPELFELVAADVRRLADQAVAIAGHGSHLIFRSCTPTSHKYSFHIVVCGVELPNSEASAAFAAFVLSQVVMMDEVKAAVDMNVYSKTQQFRMMSCRKNGGSDDREKVWDEMSTFRLRDGETQPAFALFRESLVSNVANCHPPSPDSAFSKSRLVRPARTWKIEVDIPDLDRFDIEAISTGAFNAVRHFFLEKEQPFPFELQTGRCTSYAVLIPLKRTAASLCLRCDRVHAHDNPYITVPFHRSEARFNCRRSDYSTIVEYVKPVSLEAEPTAKAESDGPKAEVEQPEKSDSLRPERSAVSSEMEVSEKPKEKPKPRPKRVIKSDPELMATIRKLAAAKAKQTRFIRKHLLTSVAGEESN